MSMFDDQPGQPNSPYPRVPATPSAPPSEPRKWYQIWWEVWSTPSSDTFRSILTEPNTSSTRAFIWIGVVAFFSGLLSSILSAVVFGGSRAVASTLICSVLAAPVGAIIGAAISAGIYHLSARIFGGRGTWEKLLFCFAAIQAPETIIGQLVYLFYPSITGSGLGGRTAALSISLLCVLGFTLFVGLYSLVLFVLAVKGAENLSTGQAIGAVLIPTLVVLAGFACIAIVAASALANVLRTLPH